MNRIERGGQSSSRAGRSNNDVRTRVKQRKRKKDLEQLRRNVKATKKRLRQIRSKGHEKHPKNSLERTLKDFAEIRQLNDDRAQGLTKSSKAICARFLRQPTDAIGIYKHGIKSTKIQRPINLDANEEKRLRGDVFKLLNGDETLASSKTSQHNVVARSGCSDDEKNDDKGDVDSTPRHFQSNTIKSNGALSGVSSNPKWKSHEKMEKKAVDKQNKCETKLIVSGSSSTQRADMIKQRLFENSHDEDDSEPVNFPKFQPLQFAFRASQAANLEGASPSYPPQQQINDGLQSVRRWGGCPAFHYRELCRAVQSENFEFNYAHHRLPDYLIRTRMELAEIYAEMHGRTLSSSEASKKPSKMSETISEFQACSGVLPGASRSSVTQNNWQNNTNKCLTSLWNLGNMNMNLLAPPGTRKHPKHLPKMLYVGNLEAEARKAQHPDAFNSKKVPPVVNFEEKPEYFSGQNSSTLESSPCVGWDAEMEYQQNLMRRKNVKHVPAILRRGSSRHDANLVQSQMNRREVIQQESLRKFAESTDKLHENESHLENTNYHLPTPSFIARTENNFYPTITHNEAYFKAHSSACHVNQFDAEHTKRAAEKIEVIEHRENSRPSATWIPSHTSHNENFAHHLKNWKTMYADVPSFHRGAQFHCCSRPQPGCRECGPLRFAQHYSSYVNSDGLNSHQHSQSTCCTAQSMCQRIERCVSVECNPPDAENDVLSNFKVLSFEEEEPYKPPFDHQSPWSRLQGQPCKYLAVPTHVSEHPRRIPVYVDPTKLAEAREKARKAKFFNDPAFNNASHPRNRLAEIGKIPIEVKKLIEENKARNSSNFPVQENFYRPTRDLGQGNLIQFRNSHGPSDVAVPDRQDKMFVPKYHYHENQMNHHISQNLPIFKGHNRQY